MKKTILDNHIQKLMNESGIGLKQLSDITEISVTSLWKIKTLKCEPKFRNMNQIAKAFNKNINDVFYEREINLFKPVLSFASLLLIVWFLSCCKIETCEGQIDLTVKLLPQSGYITTFMINPRKF